MSLTFTPKKVSLFSLFTVCILVFLLFLHAPSDGLKVDNEAPAQEKQRIQTHVEVLSASISATSTAVSRQRGRVISIVDGDTIEVDIQGTRYKVRYIGIDTPETVDPRRPVGCFGVQAKQRNTELVFGKEVILVQDVSDTDKYGRLLRYVYLDDIFVNNVLVMEGYASAATYPPDVLYQSQFLESERTAREQKKGMWNACPVVKPVSPTSSYTGRCTYQCSGKDVDCSDFSSQKQAQEYVHCCGFSAVNDPMNLDGIGIGDGIVCEMLP
jgi:micrococcal nuclease